MELDLVAFVDVAGPRVQHEERRDPDRSDGEHGEKQVAPAVVSQEQVA